MMKDVNILKNNQVNVDKSLELFGDMETYDTMLSTFLEEVDEKLNNIAKYKEIADMANYAILVHSLKNDAKYFGFEKLADLSYQHELESKANHIYFVYENYDTLMNEAKRIVNIVKQYFGQEVQSVDVNSNVKVEKTILVVDDSDVISNFTKKVFNNIYNVIVSKDGNEAIKTILNDNNICAMLLDLNMPNIDGFTVLEYMQHNNLLEKIPTAIITGVGEEEIIAKAFEYSIVDVLRKPFNERDVKTVVEKLLGEGE